MTNVEAALALLFWELSVTALSLTAVAGVRPAALQLAATIGLNIAISSFAAAPLCFLRMNSPAAYLSLAALFLALALVLGWLRRADLRRSFAAAVRYRLDAMAIWFGLGSLLAFAIRPIEEGDSLCNLHSMMGWIQNKTTPYEYANNYVPFWELSFVPGLVLTHRDLFLWLGSLKPILLLALVLFLIAREMELPERLAIGVIPLLLLFPHLWLGPSGVASIKNDMIHAAGYALAALLAARTAARGKAAGIDALLAALAAAFICTKSSGPVALLLGGVTAAVLGRRWIVRNWQRAAVGGIAVAGVWFAAAGRYYLHYFRIYGNPVYPYTIKVGPIHFPGLGDLSATSILYSLKYPDLWGFLFLPEGGLSPDGLLFPLVLPAILIGSAVVLAIAFRQRRVTVLTTLAVFQLIAWFVYLRSIYSASGWPGDLAFVRNDLNSTRYIEGPFLIGELCLVWLLYRIRTPYAVIVGLVSVQAVSSFVIVLRRAPDRPWMLAGLCGLALALLSLTLRGRFLVPAAAAILAISVFAGTYLVERRRPLWLIPAQSLYLPLYDLPAQDLYYLVEEEASTPPFWHFALLGRHLQHTSDSGNRASLLARRNPPHYVAWTRSGPEVPAPELAGYTPRVVSPRGVLFEHP